MTPRMQAQFNGDKFYNGLPCAKCKGTHRYTANAHCVACDKLKPRTKQKVRKYVRKRTQTYWFANCNHCGKEFRTFPSKLVRGWGKFCSKPCALAERENHKVLSKVRERSVAAG